MSSIVERAEGTARPRRHETVLHDPPSDRTPGEARSRPRLDRRRYRRVRWFILKVFLQALWWDLILNRPPLSRLRADPLRRYRAIARRYRTLAVEMGGVLIKLGQFLSIRVDVLPVEVTRELAGLQDEVPPDSWEAIAGRLAADFGRAPGEVFSEVSPSPVGSASLAQVHQARLASGEQVVIKVLRPGIEVLVETDLAAAGLALRWLKLVGRVRRRIDLDRLAAEFRRTTLRELDMAAEADSIDRFRELFADTPEVRVPQVYREASAAHALTLENVGYIKIVDTEGLAAAGIDPASVARTLYRLYMEQLFVHDFVHADPHPGNLFVEPLPTEKERAAGVSGFAPGEGAPHAPGRSFRIVFVDFGMTAVIPPRLRGALKEYLIGLGTRDAVRIVRAYQSAGVLLPGADLRRLEDAQREILDRFWGVPLGELREVAMSEARFFFRRYRDLIYEMPFQAPVDLLFASRAVGLLSGLSTSLDPDFNPWEETLPFAERIAAEEARTGLLDGLVELARQGTLAVALPERLGDFLDRGREGRLVVRADLAPETRAALERLETIGKRLGWMVVAAGLLVAGVLTGAGTLFGRAMLGLAALSFLWGMLRHR